MNPRKLSFMATTGLYLALLGMLLLAVFDVRAAAAVPVPAAQVQGMAPVEAAFTALDADRNRVLSLHEFQAGYASLQRVIALEVRLREQFRIVDADHSGAIEAGEYADLVLVQRAGKSAPVLVAFDADKNGKLEFAEYLTVVRRLGTSKPMAPAMKK